jgi:hypothetical protein
MPVNKNKFSFNHLTDTEFEEFCFDLLKTMGFINVQWRKGTGLSTSPSDRGRDIECQLIHTDIDGEKFIQNWFVEIKHHRRVVPVEKILNAIAWAEAQKPDVLLIIASNFLSNTTKDYIESYESNNRPKFRIKKWELPDLKKQSNGKPLLLSKYSLSGELEFLNIMNPAHLAYIKGLKFNTLEYFFDCLDNLEKNKRDEITGWLRHIIIKPREREPVTGYETIGELLIDKVDYDAFRSKCFQIANSGVIDGTTLVFFMVNFLLQSTFVIGDSTLIEQKAENLKDFLEFLKNLELKEPQKRRYFDEIVIPRHEEIIATLPDRIRECYALYTYFCENVVSKLLDEYPFGRTRY